MLSYHARRATVAGFALTALAVLPGAALGQDQSIPPAAPSQVAAQENYKIAPEDTITITVLRHPEFSGDFFVPDDGIIEVPAVGSVKVSGKTLPEVARYVTDWLGRTRLKKPEVTVTIKVPRIRRVYVLGDVKLSGAYDWKPGWTVAQLLSTAGGLDVNIQRSDVLLRLQRPDGSVKASRMMADALAHPQDPDLVVEPGDTLLAESIGTAPIYVTGDVIKPGPYRVRADSASVLSAIAEAGGLAPDASMTVRILHPDGSSTTADISPALVQGKPIDNPKLAPGDMILVSQNTNTITLLGYVQHPGYYPMPQGRQLRLSEAIAAAQGPTTTMGSRGLIVEVGLVRVEDGRSVSHKFNLSKYFKKGDPTENPVVLPGDVIYVPRSNGIELDTVIQAIAAGGLLYYNVRH